MLLGLLLEKNGIKVDDPEVAEMVRPLRSQDIERALEKQLSKPKPINLLRK
jgi:ribosomal protein L12E/L44/L45/RPP1/RPP2